MGYFFDFLTGGNIKVASYSLADLHFYYNCNYLQTYIIKLTSIFQVLTSSDNVLMSQNKYNKSIISMNIIMNNSIKNYIDLVILDLNTYKAPENIFYYETYNSFYKEVEKYLLNKGIERCYVNGDNTNITKDYISNMHKNISHIV